MFKLAGKQSLDDCKWYGVEGQIQTEEDQRKALEALKKAAERFAQRQKMMAPYSKEHHGGYEI